MEEIVAKFLLDTCRLRTRSSIQTAEVALLSMWLTTQHLDGGADVSDFIPLMTGSVAEFYIEPILQCFGDVDVMYHLITQLAIPRGHAPPTQLPAEFHNYVKVHEIIDSHLPGYAYLQLRYLLTECVDDGKYNAVEYDRQWYFSNRCYTSVDPGEIHGPALCEGPSGSLLSVDAVHCVRCLVWPLQAADWPTRHRNYGWPDSATVDRVVNNGLSLIHISEPTRPY